MGKVLKIAVYVALLFLGYLWIATVAKSCNKTDTAEVETMIEDTDDYASEDGFEDEFFDEDELYSENEMGGGSTPPEEEPSSSIDYTEVDEIIEQDNSDTEYIPEEEPAPTPVRTTSTNGRFLLLAGSYLIEDNAKVMVKKLKKLGYSNAEIVVFDMSQYFSVCAGRYTGLSKAQQESSTLKRKGVDNYVHTKH